MKYLGAMNKRLPGFLYLFVLLAACSSPSDMPEPALQTGVTKELAEYRKKILDNITYTLQLDIPEDKTEAIAADETIVFDLSLNRHPLQIDFKEDPSWIKSLVVNDSATPVKWEKEHLLVEPSLLRKGRNKISIRFRAGESALNRNADYLYALFVPDRARTCFPCFDQPDLKAVYNLSLTLPAGWKAMANAPQENVALHEGRQTIRFESSDTLSTYLFSFVAGRFESAKGNLGERKADFLYRETDTAKISRSLPEIFKAHAQALRYFEDWTGIPYPFKKVGFAAIPDFQFGGMEHPGVVHYKAASLFLDEGATKDQLNGRQQLIAHETAHMWFGDLVTMDWFSDVWMKEVFANLMADKSSEGTVSKEEYDLKFLLNHLPAAYSVDRTKGANPIRQDLDNLQEAGTLYGNIIYHKAPVMMLQLEKLMGEDRFQQGVREYLERFANGNASWPDLIDILDKYTDQALQAWNKVWVNEPGRPVISYTLENKDNKISSLRLSQAPEWGRGRVWPQLFDITLFYPDTAVVIPVNMNASQVVVKAAEGQKTPLFILFNSSAQGYGLWPVDRAMLPHLFTLQNPLHRAVACIALYERTLSGKGLSPEELLYRLMEGVGKEQEELNIKLITGYIHTLFWVFTNPAVRDGALAEELENTLWEAMQKQSGPNIKKLLFKSYQDIFRTAEARRRLYAVWKSEKAPDGVKLTEDDYTSLAFSLALRDSVEGSLLAEQLKRISNPDRQKRFEFIMPALSAGEAKRDAFFESLKKRSNRAKESNVLSALAYLHHPLRQSSSVRYLPETLAMLEEIQSTGDIFFPYSWLSVSFGSYQSSEAWKAVDDFLNSHPDYNLKLKAKILQTTDNLYRAQSLVK